MSSILTDDFRACFAVLPAQVQQQARRAYQLWRANPAHPGLRFKSIKGHDGVYSARIGLGWRALGHLENGTITWFWIGSHADYDRLVG